MPIKAENRGLYPPDWKQIRERILARADHRCERCGVPNYAAGWRDAEGRFHPTAGNLTHDAAGAGELSFREAQALVQHANGCYDGLGPNGERGIVIVLTIAHVNHSLEDHSDDALQAWCQACHLRHDARFHADNAAATRREKIRARGQQEMRL